MSQGATGSQAVWALLAFLLKEVRLCNGVEQKAVM